MPVYACGVLLAVLASCKSGTTVPRTEVLLQIDAERLVKLAADHLTVEIASGPFGGTLTAGDSEEFDLATDEFNWPASVALVAKPGHEDHVFDVTINIEAKGKRVARSRVKSSFVQHQTLLLKTLLYGECLGKLDCSGSETCVAPEGVARCDGADIDASTLPHYATGGAAGQAADGGETGARAGTGGVAARGGTGAGGRVGTPPDGSGGQSGSSGAGHYATVAGGSGAAGCEAHGPEQCDNGVDDDCNGQLDCADPACTTRMQCVPGGMWLGVLVPDSSPCPSGYDKGQQLVHRGLNDPGCSGCSCQAQPTTCTPQAYLYSTSAECTADNPPFRAGTLVMAGIPRKPDCSPGPIGASSGIQTPSGWRVSVTQSPAACIASGTPTPLPPTWSTNMKLCLTGGERNGCDAGYACVPKVASGQVCAQRSGPSCPTASSLQVWQREYVDERSCISCGCAAHGGSCSPLVVSLNRGSTTTGLGGTGGAGAIGGTVGLGGTGGASGAAGGLITTTTVCGSVDSSLHDAEKACLLTTYAPTASWDGTPIDPTCTANAPVSGSLRPASPLELCCAN